MCGKLPHTYPPPNETGIVFIQGYDGVDLKYVGGVEFDGGVVLDGGVELDGRMEGWS